MSWHTDPSVTEREALGFIGIRTQTTMNELHLAIPRCIDQVEAWLAQHGTTASGPPLIQYHVIDMAGALDVTIGFPTDAPAQPALLLDAPLTAGELPAGRYAALTYTDVERGIAGNAALLEWIATNGYPLDATLSEAGDAFVGRVEHFLDGPDDDPNPANWRTEVAMKLADQSGASDA